MTVEGDPNLADLVLRVEDLGKELRRQGRAAVAAQAAAESCLEALTENRRQGNEGDEATDRAWLSTLIPVADSLDRVLAQAASLSRRRVPEERPRLWPFGGSNTRPDADAEALFEGLRVLRSQLVAALEARGATVNRRTGTPVDPDLHRVVEVRGSGDEEVVVEVVRPGYGLGDRVVREAEVVVQRRGSRSAR